MASTQTESIALLRIRPELYDEITANIKEQFDSKLKFKLCFNDIGYKPLLFITNPEPDFDQSDTDRIISFMHGYLAAVRHHRTN